MNAPRFLFWSLLALLLPAQLPAADAAPCAARANVVLIPNPDHAPAFQPVQKGKKRKAGQ
jgi:hypothetical protein